jgi:hypothetical protein
MEILFFQEGLRFRYGVGTASHRAGSHLFAVQGDAAFFAGIAAVSGKQKRDFVLL